MSLFGSLYIGASGLNASQNALNTTSHNLANVETKGYVRQQILLKDSNYLTLGQTQTSILQRGLGVDIETVKQVRNTFLDQSYRQEAGRQSFYAAQYEAVSEVEDLFGELEGVAFQDILSDLSSSLHELAKDPDGTARSTFIQTAQTFLERADNIYNQLENYQINLNTKILNQVKRINEIGNEINQLNEKVRIYESSGLEKANDIRDQRNLLLDELAGMASISYDESANGTVSVYLEGMPFVTGDQVCHMGTAKISNDSEMLKAIWPSYKDADVYDLSKEPSSANNTDIGSLKGLLLTRGSREADYTDIPLKENYATEAGYKEAVDVYNNEVGSSVIMTVQAQFDQLVHGIITGINDILSPNKEVTLKDGTKVKILDQENAPVGIDDNSTSGEALFNRKAVDRYSEPKDIEILVDDGNGGTTTVTLKNARIYNEEDENNSYSLYTLGEMEMNSTILQGPEYLPLSMKTGSGDFDSEITSKLVSKWQEKFATLSPNTLTVNNFSDYYTSFTSEMANRGNRLNMISTNQASMAESIDSQRSETMGVSSDEELTNLIKYQHAYNAAARYINVIDEMLEHVVTNL